MSACIFRIKDGVTGQRIDASPLTPDRLAGLSSAQMGEIPLWAGRDHLPASQLFTIEAGSALDLRIVTGKARVDRLGAGMKQGSLTVEGDAGDYLAQGMRNGDVRVIGSCGAFAGNAMTGGLITIEGDAGLGLGAAIAGEHAGLKGGMVIVKGNAGDRVGDHQRRGTILIEGNAGSYCGTRMAAGTIAVLGSVGDHVGFGMRRGTILLARLPTEPTPTFFDAGSCDLNFLTLLIASWRTLDSRFARLDRLRKRVRRFVGDLSSGGKGEILIGLGHIGIKDKT